MLKAAGGDLGGLRDAIPNAATRRLIFERCAMFSYGKSAGMKALLALMIAFVPVLMVLMAFPELGDQVPMKVNAAGEVLRYGSKGELLFLPVMGFMLSAATVAMGLKQARKYGDDLTMATITFTRAGRNAIVQGVVFVAATGILLYGVLPGSVRVLVKISSQVLPLSYFVVYCSCCLRGRLVFGWFFLDG